MNTVWKNHKLRRQILNQFGSSTGLCYQFYDFEKKLFCFSDNIQDIAGEITQSVCSLRQWYDAIYEADRYRLKRYMKDVFQKQNDLYSFNYRMRDRREQLVWVSSKGRCTFNESGEPDYFLGVLSVWKEPDNGDEYGRHTLLLQKLQELYEQGEEGYLLMLDIDNLNQLNLKFGREFGDCVLQDLVDIMEKENSCFSKPFRNSGSSFCILASGADKDSVEAYFISVQKKMGVQCSLSGGCVSLQEYQVPESAALLNYAESALSTSRTEGKNQLVFFNPEDYERKLTAIELQMELEAAVRDNFAGFSLEYQPQIRSETFQLAGAEALLRFTSARRGNVPLSEFVPVLENSGLIVPVGLWVMRTALKQCRIWRKKFPDFRMSVNMSYVQLRRPEIQAEVLSVLKESGLPGDALMIEVTEGTELQEYTYLNTIFSAWKKEGVSISVDDFGTGYSSLGWLKRLAIDEIKIDRCFVRGIQHSAYNIRLLSNIIELANSGYLHVCCEGVETAEDLAVLETLQPDLYQGFFFSKPVDSESFFTENLRQKLKKQCTKRKYDICPGEAIIEEQMKLEHDILEKTDDAISVCDVDTKEVYYLNAAAQRMFGVKNYRGRKCYEVLRGRETPCESCVNDRLRHDSFYIREDMNDYCDRHFMLRDKLMDSVGRTLRLQVAMDITKREYISQQTRERLEFANRITDCVDLLSRQQDWCHAVETALASMGEFYKADRAYLFEQTPGQSGCWDNTFEWCAPGVISQKKNLQGIPPEGVARWIEDFNVRGSVIIYNLEPLRKKNRLEWEILNEQGIQRVISVPLMSGGEIAGFIGVDNPRYAIQDDTQARVLASFLMARFRRERKEWQHG